jgi:Tol biopolymer transport system component
MGGMVWDHWDACLLNLETHGDRRLTNENYYGGGPIAFVDGGSAIIYSAMSHGGNLSSNLYKVSLNSKSGPEPFMPNTGVSKGAAWASGVSASRDGRLITFLSDRETPYAYDVFVADRSGEHAKPVHITKLSSYNSSPVIAPDDRSVYFLAGTESNAHARPIYSLYRTDLAGNTAKIAGSELFTNPARWNGK